MKGIARRKALALCCMAGALLMTVPYAEASSKSDKDKDKGKKVKVEVEYDFKAGLVQCDDVLPPSPCGTDPLIGGKVEIEKDGSVEVHVAGALPVATYDVVYASLDGSTLPIGSITTDSRGNARMTWWRVFTLGDTDAGNLMLERGGLTQFVSGFAVIR